MNKYIQFIIDKNFRFSVLASRGVFNYMSDEKFLKKWSVIIKVEAENSPKV